jgi:tetratricopeptide (TPR) repeat protein/tRNA A-37 threonylcarbamoyl transferase component Bud32
VPDHTRSLPPAGRPTADPSPSGATRNANEPTAAPDAARPASPDSPLPPAASRYELLAEIARGGMGIIYRATDTVLGREVAVKVLQDKFGPASAAARRFADEARIAGQLQHPGIPPIHDLGTLPDGRLFLAMKLIKGETLDDLLKNRPDPSAERGRFVAAFEQVCQALAYAHAHDVIHRDLKPANVMVGSFGEVQVMDWGLAKVLTASRERERAEGDAGETAAATDIRSLRDSDRSFTQAGSVLGTPAYMPPEQALGAIGRIDARSDVFGLGAVLAVILTGQPPFAASSAETTRIRAAQGKVDECFARLDACGADPGLVGLCKRCLAPDPAARPADAGEVAKAVAGLRQAAEERARQAELERVLAKGERAKAELRAAEQRKRRRVQLALGAAVLLLAAGGGAFAWWRHKQAAERSLADERRKSAELRAEAEAQKARAEAENARSGVHALLAASTDLRRRYQFKDAAVALDQAEQLTAKGAANLRPVVKWAKANLALARRLDDIRMKQSTWIAEAGGKGKGRFDRVGAARDYPEVFRAAGLDVLGADPGTVAAAVAGSPVRAELVAALDDWAALPLEEPVRGCILGLLRRADPGPWLDRFRDPAVRNNPLRLWWLARSADPAHLPPATLTALAEVMAARGLNPMPLLVRAQFAHPGDFLIPFQLGRSAKDAADQVAHYRAARVTRPGNLAVLNNLGLALKDKGDVDGAIAACKEALTHDPKSAKVHNNLGLALKGKGELDGAIAAYKEALTHDPEYAQAHTNLGLALTDKGDVDGAIAAYKEALTHDPKFAFAHYSLGLALKDKGDLDGAITAYKEALTHDPKSANAHYSLGNSLKDKGDLDGAITAYKEALTHDPKSANAHTNLGAVYLAQKKYPEAIACARAAIESNPQHSNAHALLGHLLQLRGDLPGARAALTEAAELDPRWKPMLAKLPPVPIAPAPRPVPPKP